MIFLICCWICCKILLRIFASIFIKDIGLWFSFLVVSLPGFGIRVMAASENYFGSVPSSNFWKSLRGMDINSSRMFGRTHLWSHLVLDFVKCFSASIEMIMWFLTFLLLMWCMMLMICVCWTILVNLGWIPLGCGVWYFLCVIGFGWLKFCWEFLHPYSSNKLAYTFLFW